MFPFDLKYQLLYFFIIIICIKWFNKIQLVEIKLNSVYYMKYVFHILKVNRISIYENHKTINKHNLYQNKYGNPRKEYYRTFGKRTLLFNCTYCTARCWDLVTGVFMSLLSVWVGTGYDNLGLG